MNRPSTAKPRAAAAASDPARRAAWQVLRRVRRGADWERAWETVRLPSGSLDRRFAYELASGCLRLRSRLDALAAPCVDRPFAELDPEVRELLRLGVYQLLEVDRVADHAAVHATVQLTKSVRPQAAGLVNAVLRRLQRQGDLGACEPQPWTDPRRRLIEKHSHPEWIVDRWLSRFGYEATEALCRYDNRRPRWSLRVNRRRTTRAALLERFAATAAGDWSEWSIVCADSRTAEQCVRAGVASVQDESAILVGDATGARAGESWLDVAAAPGGKACHLAEIVGTGGRVRAVDVSERRLARLRDNVARLGLQNVRVESGDARQLAVDEPYDGVLVDAPCTGLGVLGRRPDARWRKRSEDLPRLATLQLEMLQAAVSHVRPGGLLVYSVCSFEPEETTDVVRRFAAAHPEMQLQSAPVPEALQQQPGLLYFLPQEHELDGGFVARWRRI